MDVPIAADVLGTLGAICWSVQVLHPAEIFGSRADHHINS